MPTFARARIVDRLKALEARLASRGRQLAFISFEEPGLPPYAERLEAFKVEHGVRDADTVYEVIVSFS